jgi:hypothetical protein
VIISTSRAEKAQKVMNPDCCNTDDNAFAKARLQSAISTVRGPFAGTERSLPTLETLQRPEVAGLHGVPKRETALG